MVGNGSGTTEQLLCDTPCPGIGAAFEQVDRGNLGPRFPFPVSKGPGGSHDPGDQVGLRGVFVGHVSVNQSIEDVSRDVQVDRTAVAEVAAGPSPADDDTFLGEEVIDQAGMHVPRTPVSAAAKLGRHVTDGSGGEDVLQSADLGGCEPGDVTAGSERQQRPGAGRRPRPSGAALLVGEPVDAVWIDQPSTGDLTCVEPSDPNQLADPFE